MLHAKLLVIDGCRAVVGSDNLTARALHFNLEVGLLIGDAEVAGPLERDVLSLIEAGGLQPSATGRCDTTSQAAACSKRDRGQGSEGDNPAWPLAALSP